MLETIVAKVRLLRLLLSVLLITSSAASPLAVAVNGETHGRPAQNSPDVTFVLNRLQENPKLYSLVISDTDEHVISGTFSIERLQILRAILVEAEKFALTSEAVGAKEPITTRFMDKQEAAFICDVQKTGMESEFFLTLSTESGRLTLNAGRIIRSTKREQGIFFELLSRLEAVLPKLPAPSK